MRYAGIFTSGKEKQCEYIAADTLGECKQAILEYASDAKDIRCIRVRSAGEFIRISLQFDKPDALRKCEKCGKVIAAHFTNGQCVEEQVQ